MKSNGMFLVAEYEAPEDMPVFRFIWWSVKIQSRKGIERAAEEESEGANALMRDGKWTAADGADRAKSLTLQSVPLLSVMMGFFAGLTGSVLGNTITHFAAADDRNPFVPGNWVWTGLLGLCLLMALYLSLWADRLAQLYRAKGVGAAYGVGATLH